MLCIMKSRMQHCNQAIIAHSEFCFDVGISLCQETYPNPSTTECRWPILEWTGRRNIRAKNQFLWKCRKMSKSVYLTLKAKRTKRNKHGKQMLRRQCQPSIPLHMLRVSWCNMKTRFWWKRNYGSTFLGITIKCKKKYYQKAFALFNPVKRCEEGKK